MGSTWSLPAGTSSTAGPERSSTRFTMKPAPSYKAKRSSKSISRVASRFAVTINSELVRNASKDCSSPGTPPFLQGNPPARRCVLETPGHRGKGKAKHAEIDDKSVLHRRSYFDDQRLWHGG